MAHHEDHSADLPDARTSQAPEQEAHPFQALLIRLFWLALGNALLLIFAAFIAKLEPWTLTLVDAGYWGIVAMLLLARFVDIKRFHGETSNGQPATMGHLRRYAAMLVASAAAIWAISQSVTL